MFLEKLMEPLMLEQWREFSRVTKCHIYFNDFEEDDEKVRDHCHNTGKYRGAAHQKCNLWYAIPNYIPAVFHNLSGYDEHLFIRELGKKFHSRSISIIAENKEKYISFNINITVDKYKTPLGETEEIKRQL